jgi:hypothetical protein
MGGFPGKRKKVFRHNNDVEELGHRGPQSSDSVVARTLSYQRLLRFVRYIVIEEQRGLKTI